MKSDFVKVWRILSKKERRQLSLVSGLQAFSGLMDMAGVVSIVPFLSVAADTKMLRTNALLSTMQHLTGFPDGHFVILLGVLSLVILILNQAVSLGCKWYGQFVVHRIWWALHKRMFRYYLNQPYLYHLQHSSTVLLEKLQVRVNAAVGGVISPIFLLMSSFFSTLFMLCLLIWAEPVLTSALLGIIGTFYLLIYQKIKAKLDFYGAVGPEFSRKSFNLIAEALGAVKEIKVRCNGQIYLNLFDPLARRYCDSQVKIQLFSDVPRGMVEVVAFGGILFIALLMISSSGFQKAIPLLGMYALALKRILPAVQLAYQQIALIRFYHPSLQVVYNDMLAAIRSQEIVKTVNIKAKRDRRKGTIELKDLSFSYPETAKRVLDSITLEIPRGSMIGIAGCSGAGKTTLVDLILGLFEPASGSILIDGKPLNDESLTNWQSGLGYVPQAAFIADGTIARNIAFGIPESFIELQKAREVARVAGIAEFIESELPRQYETLVGERGVRLSGGQCQRLSIARALYHDPDVLILDEATSALDGITEEQVIRSIRTLLGQKTILMIAHRLTTLKECDNIFLLEEGKLIDQGTYQSLMEHNLTFRRMAREEREKESVETAEVLDKERIS